MESVVGIFNSFADAKRAVAILRSLGFLENQVSILAPGASEAELEAKVPTAETEQPGMGSTLGATIGGAIGIASGATAGAAVASFLVPGVGPVIAFGLVGAALLGGGGAAAGAVAGRTLEEGIAPGLPHDELYVYEDALRRGRTVVIALAETEDSAARARTDLLRAGAESIDAAREEWWVGLRDAEREHYIKQGGDFKLDEAVYRLGFEAALHPDQRGLSYDQALPKIRKEYGEEAVRSCFREGYERGQRYRGHVKGFYKAA